MYEKNPALSTDVIKCQENSIKSRYELMIKARHFINKQNKNPNYEKKKNRSAQMKITDGKKLSTEYRKGKFSIQRPEEKPTTGNALTLIAKRRKFH